MPPNIDAIRNRLLDDARARGCRVVSRKNFFRVDGAHDAKWFCIGRTWTKVTLVGFCVSHPAVMPFSAEDSRDFKIGRVGGIFDFRDSGASKVFSAVFAAIGLRAR
jgi:hypothetical protein